jgi:hypothetical protein
MYSVSVDDVVKMSAERRDNRLGLCCDNGK